MTDIFATRLRELRIKKGLTQGQLAAELGKGESAIRMWELGKNQPNHGALLALAQIFAVSVDYLLGLESFSQYQPATERPALKTLLTLAEQASDEELATMLRILEAVRK